MATRTLAILLAAAGVAVLVIIYPRWITTPDGSTQAVRSDSSALGKGADAHNIASTTLSTPVPQVDSGPRQTVQTEQVAPDPSNASVENRPSVRGRVVLPDGLPAKGETLQFFPHLPRWMNRYEQAKAEEMFASVATDESGAFELQLDRPRRLVLRIKPKNKGLADVVLVNPPIGEPVLIELKLAGSIVGVVGASLELPEEAWVGISAKKRYGRFVDRWESVTSGLSYRIDGVAPGAHVLTLYRLGHLAQVRTADVRSGASVLVDFPSDQLSDVVGEVVDARSGQPVANAEVDLHWSFPSPVATNSAGSFLLKIALTEQLPRVGFVRANGHATAAFSVDKLGSNRIVVALDPDVAVFGRVVDNLGGPLADVDVSVLEWMSGSKPGVVSAHGRTGADGKFKVGGVGGGTSLALAARRQSFGSAVRIVGDLERSSVGLDVGNVVLEPELGIQGSVLDSQGNGLPGFTIICTREIVATGRETESLIFSWLANSDKVETADDGGFYFDGLEAGAYRIRASLVAEGEEWARESRVDVMAGMGPIVVEFRFDAGLSIGGRLLACNGEALQGAFLTLFPMKEGHGNAVGRVASGTDGRFHFHNIPPGLYRIAAQVPSSTRELGLEGGSVGTVFDGLVAGAMGLTLMLPKGKLLSGYVVDSDDQVVANAFVSTRLGSVVIDWSRTDSTGRFQVLLNDGCDLVVTPAMVEASAGGSMEVPDNQPGRRVVVLGVDQQAGPILVRMPFSSNQQ